VSVDRRLDQRILRGPAATIGVTWSDQNDTPVAATSPPEVEVTAYDGTVVHTATATEGVDEEGRYETTLPPAATALLDRLTATWAVDDDVRTTTHDVTGGWYLSLPEMRRAALTDLAKFSDEQLLLARLEAENEVEDICGTAFVPRFTVASAVGDGGGTLTVPVDAVRVVRAVTVRPLDGSTVAWTLGQVAGVRVDQAGGLVAPWSLFWPAGATVEVAVEHGADRPPVELTQVMLRRIRTSVLNQRPDVTIVDPNGQPVEDSRPGRWRTGDPVVDAVYSRFSRRGQGGKKAIAASRPLVYDQQQTSLFHRRAR
jgi:hypothetical protein